MGRSRLRAVSYVLAPAIVIAFAVLGYYTWLNSTRFARLGESTIVESLLILAREKVDTVETYVIDADNTLFALIDPADPESIESGWRPVASEQTPSIRAVVVLDEEFKRLGDSVRGSRRDRREFLRRLDRKLLASLNLQDVKTGRLKHAHVSLDKRNYLLSHQAFDTELGVRHVIAHHDTGYMVREFFPKLFAAQEARGLYNVVGERNQRVFGPDLKEAGEFLVGHRFPTTLYNWRLQVAPKEGAELEAQQRTKRRIDVAMPLAALGVLTLSFVFFLYVAAQERRLNKLKSEFVANVSHELKTPLSVIRMFTDLLRTSRVASDDKRQQYLEIIGGESERLSALIDNVLDFSALERGRQTYRPDNIDLRDTVERARQAFSHRQGGEQVTLIADPDPLYAEADQDAVTLAVINLLDNAVKYGGEGPVELSIAEHGSQAAISVRDHGPGIDKDDAKQIFERFYRGKHASHARGSGIGLSLVKHIAQSHGGNVWARTHPEGGAEIGFSIPTG